MEPIIDLTIVNESPSFWVFILPPFFAAVIGAGSALLAAKWTGRLTLNSTRELVEADSDRARADREFQAKLRLLEPVRDAVAEFLVSYQTVVAAVSTQALFGGFEEQMGQRSVQFSDASIGMDRALSRVDDFELRMRIAGYLGGIMEAHGELTKMLPRMESAVALEWVKKQNTAWTQYRFNAAQISRDLNIRLGDASPLGSLAPLEVPEWLHVVGIGEDSGPDGDDSRL